jgi:hypothetical protein
MKLFFLITTLFFSYCAFGAEGPGAPSQGYPPEPPKGANGPAQPR